MNRKILIMGLPGSGKTTLARVLGRRLGAVHFDADEIRANINKDLAFSREDRIEQARRMGWLCDQVVKSGGAAIGDFVCPLVDTRIAFGPAFTIWVDRISAGRFEDTNRMFEPPDSYDIRVEADGTPEHWAELAATALEPTFDPRKPTALFIGRYQPFHEGHRQLILEGMRRVGQVCIAVRDTAGTSESDPFSFQYVKSRIETMMRDYAGRCIVVQVPNISAVFYGRDVGYKVERIDLDEALTALSATEIRRQMGR